MKLEDIMLNDIRQSQKGKYSMIPFNEVSDIVKLIETKNGMAVSRGWELGRSGELFGGHSFSYAR